MTGHKQWVTTVAWEPLHLATGGQARRLASASKDGDVRIWDVLLGKCLRSLTGHTMSVTCLRWGGSGLVYSAAQDRTIKVWRPDDGALCRTLQGHGHWVNVLALNTDYVIRTGAFEPSKAKIVHDDTVIPGETAAKMALKRYNEVVAVAGEEVLVSGSDDFTLFLWHPASEKKSLGRMTGHQQLVNDVKFSPDGRLLASASFDKSLQLWSARTGKLDTDLPGHGDEVYTVDWSPDGQRVVSGGKDKLLRIWRK